MLLARRMALVHEASEPAAGMMVTSNVRLVRPFGEGGMGSVWIAEHLSLRTMVVVKFMSRDLAKSSEAIARFSREAAAASQVKSPHVVQMLDHGVGETGAPYIVMELLEGKDLEQHLSESGVLGAREVVGIVAQLARALAKAHERGIVHRDIKPSNVFLVDAGGGELFVKLLDFGIAKGPEVGIIGSTTRTGAFVGSPYYMSPEQVVGAKNIDFRTDLWSLGVVVYEALTGNRPFYADNVGALALKIHRDPLPVPTKDNAALPAAIDGWFKHACARDPAARFASAKEMAEALAVAMTGESLPPGLRMDSATSGRAMGLAATEDASGASSTVRSGADARSETGGGVGLVTTGHAVPLSRGRWWMLGGIAAAAVVIGFLAPKLMSGSKTPAIEPLSTAPASAAASAAAAPRSSAWAVAPRPADREQANDQAVASATSAAAAVGSAPASTAGPAAAAQAGRAMLSGAAPGPHGAKPRPVAAAASASAPAAARPAPAPTTARGSDDDIK
jgi:serine/threonine-protein kinase